MPIGRKFKKNAVAQAVIYGVITGIIGVIAFVLILNLPKEPDSQGEIITTSQQPTVDKEKETKSDQVSQQFFALQHGVFSSFESAEQFLAPYPTLKNAAIVRVGDQFFIWSKIDTEKVEGATQTIPSSFYKAITVSSSCPNPAEQQLPQTLKDPKWLTLKEVSADQKAKLPADWGTIIPGIQKLSENNSVIRLHALINYFERLNCLKINF